MGCRSFTITFHSRSFFRVITNHSFPTLEQCCKTVNKRSSSPLTVLLSWWCSDDDDQMISPLPAWSSNWHSGLILDFQMFSPLSWCALAEHQRSILREFKEAWRVVLVWHLMTSLVIPVLSSWQISSWIKNVWSTCCSSDLCGNFSPHPGSPESSWWILLDASEPQSSTFFTHSLRNTRDVLPFFNRGSAEERDSGAVLHAELSWWPRQQQVGRGSAQQAPPCPRLLRYEEENRRNTQQ